ncbi:hypothetical protein ABZ746_31825 [Streptomyces sp. NPDC020096]
MKRVLVVYYSQSGDVRNALEALTAPLQAPDVEICWLRIDTAPAYSFPWGAREFFDCMPESLNGEPPPLAPVGLDPGERFDLVILGWQVWFLSPSLPIQAFLTASEAEVLRGARVVSVTCCRQMWQRAYARARALIARAGGRHTDSIVLTHQGGSLAGYITAPLLMITGRRDKRILLPAAGVARGDIDALGRVGERLLETRDRWADPEPAPLLSDVAPVNLDVGSLLPEAAVVAPMEAIARLARRCGRPGSLARQPVIGLFVLMLVTWLPVLLLASALLTPVLRVVFARRLNRYVRGLRP